MFKKLLLALVFTLHLVFPAHAYIGPGMGGGAIAALIGLLGSVILAFVGILYFPIKRALKRRKAKAKEATQAEIK